MPLHDTYLPGIGTVSCLRADHVSDIHGQVKHYFKHGISVKPGDTVFDVGANIGLFSLELQKMCQGDVVSYMFEPIPAIFAALEENARRFGHGSLKPICCGLSARSGTAEFAYCPNMPTLSTAYVEDQPELKEQVRDAILRNLRETHWRVRWLQWLPGFLRSRVLDKTVRQMFATEMVQCSLKTVSEVIREFGVERIDLLKIDVEKSEYDVLLGIESADWPKIQQLVMEVHDLDGRIAKIRDLLMAHGIDQVFTEQEPVLRGSNVYGLYARRL
jgi:FkbM family methyltransferase